MIYCEIVNNSKIQMELKNVSYWVEGQAVGIAIGVYHMLYMVYSLFFDQEIFQQTDIGVIIGIAAFSILGITMTCVMIYGFVYVISEFLKEFFLGRV